MAPVANQPNMRVTRQRAARERMALQQQQQQLQSEPTPSGGEPMAVEPSSFNIDPLSNRDPQLCHHYSKEIYQYLHTLELEHRVSPHFMQVRLTLPAPTPTSCRTTRRQERLPGGLRSSDRSRPVGPRPRLAVCLFPFFAALPVAGLPSLFYPQSQRDINATMRGILIDWLVEVAEEYRLEGETLYLAVNYIDRFLSHVPVNRSKLQLVGVTCMLVAAKYEEIHPPAVDEFVYISDNTYKREEILHMEGMVLNRLNFELSVATAKVFINRFLKAAKAGECDSTTEMLCKYLCELTLQEYSFIKYRPSEIAAAGLRLALHTMRLPAWTPLLEQVSGYSADDLAGCVTEMHAVFRKAENNSLQAVREKYSHAKFLCVSTLVPPDTTP